MPHTPGPWEITKEWLSIQAYPWGDVVRICSNPQGGIGDLYTHNWRANARLIAAAPDLLAACEALVKTCQERFEGLEIVALVPGDLRRAVDAGVAAIAKAGADDDCKIQD
jgi:hypothetical protein